MTKYVVLTANNVYTNIEIEGPYKTKKEARSVLKGAFDCFPARQGEWKREKDFISYFDAPSNDFYYGVIKTIEV